MTQTSLNLELLGSELEKLTSTVAKLKEFDKRVPEKRRKHARRKWMFQDSDKTSALMAAKGAGYSLRQGTETDEDPFTTLYEQYNLIQPRYLFKDLYDIVEECDILRTCIDILVEGVDGNGHDFAFKGDDKTERDSEQNKTTLRDITDFFAQVNERGSFSKVRRLRRFSLEATGNAAIEIVRNRLTNEIERIYYLPITYMRKAALDTIPTRHVVKLRRKGRIVNVDTWTYFRKYARLMPNGTIKWFKEFGDPRILDAESGVYVNNLSDTTFPATEVWWDEIPFRDLDYGVPHWTNGLSTIRGRILAQWVNYDLFNNQGIPPLLIAVEGGQLSSASLQEIETTIESWRDPEKFNRTCIIAADPTPMGFGDNIQKPTIQIHRLRDARAEDYMFSAFLADSENVIRRLFRLPPLLAGSTQDYNMATAYASQIVAEQQVFGPARQAFDNEVSLRILRQEMGIWDWTFKSRGPRVVGSEELAKIVRTFAQSGGATTNQIIQVANEALGTDWSLDDSIPSKIPVAIMLRLAALGRIHVDDAGKLIVLSPQEAMGQSGSFGQIGVPANPDTNGDAATRVDTADNPAQETETNSTEGSQPTPTVTIDKSANPGTGSSVSANVVVPVTDPTTDGLDKYLNLLTVMEQVSDEYEKWDPRTIDDSDFVQPGEVEP